MSATAPSSTSTRPTSTTAGSTSSTARSRQQTWAGAFTDPKLPKGFAPFGIQTLNGMVFVTYAKTQPGSDDERAGQGRGVVDAFAHGRDVPRPGRDPRSAERAVGSRLGAGRLRPLQQRPDRRQLRQRQAATPTAGTARSGIPTARCATRTASRSSIDGLWAIAFGGGVNVANDGPANSLFYTAGPDDEAGGAFGTITAVAP